MKNSEDMSAAALICFQDERWRQEEQNSSDRANSWARHSKRTALHVL